MSRLVKLRWLYKGKWWISSARKAKVGDLGLEFAYCFLVCIFLASQSQYQFTIRYSLKKNSEFVFLPWNPPPPFCQLKARYYMLLRECFSLFYCDGGLLVQCWLFSLYLPNFLKAKSMFPIKLSMVLCVHFCTLLCTWRKSLSNPEETKLCWWLDQVHSSYPHLSILFPDRSTNIVSIPGLWTSISSCHVNFMKY